MYDYRSGLLTRLLMGLCLFVWCVVGFEVLAFAEVFVFNGVRYTVVSWTGGSSILYFPGTTTTIQTTNNGGTCPQPYAYMWYGSSPGPRKFNKVGSGNVCSYYGPSSFTSLTIVDSDGDLLENSLDPCPDQKDTSVNVNIAKNRCTGAWFSMLVSGSCEIDESAQTGFKKYYNPNLTVANRNAAIQNAKDTGCYAYDAKNFTPGSYQNWWESVYSSANSTAPTAATPGETIEPADVLNLNSNSTAPPTEASSDPEMQKILQQIDRLQNSITKDLTSASENIGAKVVGSAGKIVDAINGISMGGSDTGVVSAVGSASGTAHGDATALLGAINGMSQKLGNSTGSSVPGLTLDELKSETDRIYSTEGGIGLDDSYNGFSNVVISSLTTWVDSVRAKLDSMMPEASIQASGMTSCLSYGGNIVDSSGNVYELTDYCFDSWEFNIVMIGNALLAAVSIGAFLNCFRAFRGSL